MNKILKISLVLFLLILFTPQICKAVLQVQIVETPTSKAAALKATYGVSKYSACRSEYSNSYCDFVHGLTDPASQMTCEQMIGYCLERNAVSANNNDPVQLNSRCVTKYGAESYSKGLDTSSVNQCSCNAGYMMGLNYGVFPVTYGCVSINDACKESHGANAYYAGTGKGILGCDCMKNYGFEFESKGGKCILLDDFCKSKHGEYSIGVDELSSKHCDCQVGYEWGKVFGWNNEIQCVKKVVEIVPVKTPEIINSTIDINLDEVCQTEYGKFSFWTKQKNENGQAICDCLSGYGWNQNQTSCIEPKVDLAFAKKQVGKILLQVESKGEAWYVNPRDGKMHYMADGNKAYDVMRNLGVGITNKNLEKIQTNKTFAKKNAGKIFLQVEANGEAYYVDFDGAAHYLKDGAAAYEIMRSLGLGITNDNLNKIPKGSL